MDKEMSEEEQKAADKKIEDYLNAHDEEVRHEAIIVAIKDFGSLGYFVKSIKEINRYDFEITCCRGPSYLTTAGKLIEGIIFDAAP